MAGTFNNSFFEVFDIFRRFSIFFDDFEKTSNTKGQLHRGIIVYDRKEPRYILYDLSILRKVRDRQTNRQNEYRSAQFWNFLLKVY